MRGRPDSIRGGLLPASGRALAHRHAAADPERLTGDAARVVGGEKRGGGADTGGQTTRRHGRYGRAQG